MSAKCTVCDKTCGSVLRLQDWRCLWCKAMVSARRGGPGGSWGREGLAPPVTRRRTLQVHTACKDSLVTKCPLGLCKVSVIPPTALNSIDSDGGYRALLSQPFPRIAFSGPSPPGSGIGYGGDVEMWSDRGQTQPLWGDVVVNRVLMAGCWAPWTRGPDSLPRRGRSIGY